MAVAIEQIQPGAVFRFKTANRRVTSLSSPLGAGFNVNWEYADGKKRGGRLSGSQWVHYFKANAIEQILDSARTEMNIVQLLRGNHRELMRLDCLVAADLIEGLVKIATGELKHVYNGLCPDAVEGPLVRDPECPACQLLLTAERSTN